MARRIPSPKQISAARENGARSRGPVTDAGKSASSRNAIRHGILAAAIVIEGESRQRFVALLEELHRHFQPAGEIETALVENMAVCRWRQMRVWAMEQAGLTHEIRKQSAATLAESQGAEIPVGDSPTRAALAFRALCDGSRAIEVLNRYETRFDRQYNRALERLNELRRARGTVAAA